MASVAPALSRIKSHFDEHLSTERIGQACAAANHTWWNRQLYPVTTLRLFIVALSQPGG